MAPPSKERPNWPVRANPGSSFQELSYSRSWAYISSVHENECRVRPSILSPKRFVLLPSYWSGIRVSPQWYPLNFSLSTDGRILRRLFYVNVGLYRFGHPWAECENDVRTRKLHAGQGAENSVTQRILPYHPMRCHDVRIQ